MHQHSLPLSPPDRRATQALTAGQFFANKDRLARWCLAALVISGLTNGLVLLLLLQLARKEPWFFALDPAGNWYRGHGTRFVEARELHAQQAIQATTALLYRNQDDFDFPERLSDLFSLAAMEAASNLKNSEAQEFQEKAISQKAYVARVEALDTRPDLVRVLVSGKLERRGTFHQHPFTESLPYRLRLTFRFNPDLLKSGQFPTVVEDFQLRYETNETSN